MSERKPTAIFRDDKKPPATMKALSVQLPYASWIADGSKPIETRTWATHYRGDILICAGKRIHPLTDSIDRDDYKPSRGKALCVANLVNVRPMVLGDQHAAKCRIYDGAFSWELEDVRRVDPFDVKGQLSLFNVDLWLIRYQTLKMYVDNRDCDFVIASNPDEAKLIWCMHYNCDPGLHPEKGFHEYTELNFEFAKSSTCLAGSVKMVSEWIAIRGRGWFASSQAV